MKTIFLLVVVSAALLWHSGCLDLDSFMYTPQPLASYTLSAAVIPESSRTRVVMISQGKKIYGYFVRSSGAHAGHTVLYNHGRRDNLQYYWDRVELLYRMGFNVFVYDYQGYGMSEGEPGESALYADARAALNYLRSRDDVEDSTITIYGFSLGCAAAVDLAASAFTPRTLILEAPFASGTTLVQSGALLDIPGSYVLKGEYNNAEKIKKVHAPLLVMHGEDDTFIDIDKNGLVVFNNANKPKIFIRVPGANHSEIPDKLGRQKYLSTVTDFILHPHRQ